MPCCTSTGAVRARRRRTRPASSRPGSSRARRPDAAPGRPVRRARARARARAPCENPATIALRPLRSRAPPHCSSTSTSSSASALAVDRRRLTAEHPYQAYPGVPGTANGARAAPPRARRRGRGTAAGRRDRARRRRSRAPAAATGRRGSLHHVRHERHGGRLRMGSALPTRVAGAPCGRSRTRSGSVSGRACAPRRRARGA